MSKIWKIDCPSCGNPWDLSKSEVHSCGAVFRLPEGLKRPSKYGSMAPGMISRIAEQSKALKSMAGVFEKGAIWMYNELGVFSMQMVENISSTYKRLQDHADTSFFEENKAKTKAVTELAAGKSYRDQLEKTVVSLKDENQVLKDAHETGETERKRLLSEVKKYKDYSQYLEEKKIFGWQYWIAMAGMGLICIILLFKNYIKH